MNLRKLVKRANDSHPVVTSFAIIIGTPVLLLVLVLVLGGFGSRLAATLSGTPGMVLATIISVVLIIATGALFLSVLAFPFALGTFIFAALGDARDARKSRSYAVHHDDETEESDRPKSDRRS